VTYREAMLNASRDYLAAVLRQTDNNVTEAARISGLNRGDFYKKLARSGLSTERRCRRRDGNEAWQSLSGAPP